MSTPTCPGDLKDELVEHVIDGKSHSRLAIVIFSPVKSDDKERRGEVCQVLRFEASALCTKIHSTWSRNVLDLEDKLVSAHEDI